ncbi:hypothetical protein [Yersinia frederiksenii]|uniref:hypothetical protein n=1 Tax=Yersinia frederiksenii TaxID=29484 RepID=UPI0005E60488|nr:hypothetical protein [Yersinia frederiksenii]CNF61202.1 Uncharacterised protein [Yersinia frederiksenii]
MHVQFADANEAVIISYFCCQQDPIYYDFLGEVEADDPRYIVFYEKMPDYVQVSLPTPIYP